MQLVEGEVGKVWIIEDLRPDLPLLFAVDRGTFEEITAQITEYPILQEDYSKLRVAANQIQGANTLLWEDNQKLQRQIQLQKIIMYIELGLVVSGILGIVAVVVFK